jgi:hypothetical protein
MRWVANFMRGTIRCVFPIFTLALWTALLSIGQGRDVMRRIVERLALDGSASDLLFLAGAAAVLSFSVWYSIRWLLSANTTSLRLTDSGGGSGPHVTVPRTWLPRLAGAYVPLWAAIVFFQRETAPAQAWGRWTAATAFFTLAIVLLALYSWRRQIVEKAMVRAGFTAPGQRATAREAETTNAPLPASTIRVMLWALILSGIGALQVLMFPLSVPRVAGSAALAGFALASINLFGSLLLTLLPLRRDLPVLAPWVLGVAALASNVNDNHFSNDDRSAAWAGPRPDVGAAFQQWLAHHRGQTDVYVVATEGGGLRAAYWTAAVLQDLDQRPDIDLRNRLFAISSVSGGSVGAGTWLAAMRPALCPAATQGPGPALTDAATRALSIDYLSSIIGYFFYPDLMQQFLPFPVQMFDRSHALEEGLMRSLSRVPGRPLEQSAGEFYGPCRGLLPVLLLNATESETGQRAILTHLDTSKFVQTFQLRGVPASAPASVRGTCVRDPSTDHQSMAGLMHHSARFPIVSPAGSVTDRCDRDRMVYGRPVIAHLVDGGYFDNSGIVTAMETIHQMQQAAGAGGPSRYHLLVIDNDAYPECGSHLDGQCHPASDRPSDYPHVGEFLHEIVPIIGGLYNVRDGHVHEALAQAMLDVGRDPAVDIVQIYRLPAPGAPSPLAAAASPSPAASEADVEAPLGWALSREVINAMNLQARERVARLVLPVRTAPPPTPAKEGT